MPNRLILFHGVHVVYVDEPFRADNIPTPMKDMLCLSPFVGYNRIHIGTKIATIEVQWIATSFNSLFEKCFLAI